MARLGITHTALGICRADPDCDVIDPFKVSLMNDLVLQAGDDHVARMAHEGDPVRAVVELVWNAVDAEATKITVDLRRSALDAIDAVEVSDI